MTTPGLSKIIEMKGLYTNPNPLAVDDATFTVLDNFVMDRQGVAQSRRGFLGGSTIPSGAVSIEAIFPLATANGSGGGTFLVVILTHASGSHLYYFDGSAFTDLGAIGAVSFTQLPKCASSNGNYYITNSTGLLCYENAGGSAFRVAGALKGIGFDPLNSFPTVNGDAAGTPNQLADGYQAAYRMTLLYRDANNNVIEGSPSGRYVASNTSGSAHCPKIRCILPAETTTSWWLRLYRSNFVTNGYSSTFLPYIVPADDMQMVYESPVFSGTDISNGYYDISDIAPDNLKGAYLYTSPNAGLGIQATNDPPPLVKDLASYKNRLWGANITSRHRFNFTLLSIQVGGSGPGVQSGDTVTMAGVTYTWGATQDPTTNKVKIILPAGASSLATSLEQSARNLVACINQSAQSGASPYKVYAYYASGPLDLPGKILIEARSPGGSAFTAQVSANGTAFQPNLTAAQNSTATTLGNAVAFSNALEPEAWPPGQYVLIGTQETNVIRVFPLKDGLLCFKDGAGGVWKVTGDDVTNFRVTPVDLTCQLFAPESVAGLNQMAICLSKKGFMQVGLSGVTPISDPILADVLTNVLAPLIGSNYSLLPWAFASDLDRRYVCFFGSGSPGVPPVNYPTKAYVFNATTGAWSTWSFPNWALVSSYVGASCGAVSPVDNKIYLGFSGGADYLTYPPRVVSERKSYSSSDYQDTPDGGSSATTIAITKTMQWKANVGSEPMEMKQFRELVFVAEGVPTALTIQCTNEDNSPAAFSETPSSKKIRVLVPLEAQRGRSLNVSVVHATKSEDFVLDGLQIRWNQYGGKVGR